MRRAWTVLLALVLACGHTDTYHATGDVLAVDADQRHVTIRHDDIPGLMGAMTMRFAVDAPATLHGVAPGTHVRFVLRQAEDGFAIVDLRAVAGGG